MKPISLIAAVICLFSFCSCSTTYRPTNLVIDDKKVNVPLPSNIGSGWILINEYKVLCYDYKTDNHKSSHEFIPERGYGDIFFLHEYKNIEKDDFWAGIILYLVFDDFKKQDTGKDDQNKTTADIRTEMYNVLISKIKHIVKNKKFNQEYENDLLKKFLRHDIVLNSENLNNIEEVKAALNINSILRHFDRLDKNINAYPPQSLIISCQPSIEIYAARKVFSELTTKASFIFVPTEHAVSPTAHISAYLFMPFVSKEKATPLLDNISLDIGMVGKDTSDSARQDYTDSDNKFMVGIGYTFSDLFSIQIGDVFWFEEGEVDNNFYFGISVDILNIGSKLKK